MSARRGRSIKRRPGYLDVQVVEAKDVTTNADPPASFFSSFFSSNRNTTVEHSVYCRVALQKQEFVTTPISCPQASSQESAREKFAPVFHEDCTFTFDDPYSALVVELYDRCSSNATEDTPIATAVIDQESFAHGKLYDFWVTLQPRAVAPPRSGSASSSSCSSSSSSPARRSGSGTEANDSTSPRSSRYAQSAPVLSAAAMNRTTTHSPPPRQLQSQQQLPHGHSFVSMSSDSIRHSPSRSPRHNPLFSSSLSPLPSPSPEHVVCPTAIDTRSNPHDLALQQSQRDLYEHEQERKWQQKGEQQEQQQQQQQQQQQLPPCVHLIIYKSRTASNGILKHFGVPMQTIPFRFDVGDIILINSDSLLSHVTKVSTWSEWDHVGMVVRARGSADLFLFESTSDGVEIYPLEKSLALYRPSSQLGVRRLQIERTSEMMEALYQFIEETDGTPYNKNVFHLYWASRGTHEVESLSSMFCSQLVAAAFKRIGVLSEDTLSNNYLPFHFAEDLKGNLKNGRFSKVRHVPKPESLPPSRRKSDHLHTRKVVSPVPVVSAVALSTKMAVKRKVYASGKLIRRKRVPEALFPNAGSGTSSSSSSSSTNDSSNIDGGVPTAVGDDGHRSASSMRGDVGQRDDGVVGADAEGDVPPRSASFGGLSLVGDDGGFYIDDIHHVHEGHKEAPGGNDEKSRDQNHFRRSKSQAAGAAAEDSSSSPPPPANDRHHHKSGRRRRHRNTSISPRSVLDSDAIAASDIAADSAEGSNRHRKHKRRHSHKKNGHRRNAASEDALTSDLGTATLGSDDSEREDRSNEEEEQACRSAPSDASAPSPPPAPEQAKRAHSRGAGLATSSSHTRIPRNKSSKRKHKVLTPDVEYTFSVITVHGRDWRVSKTYKEVDEFDTEFRVRYMYLPSFPPAFKYNPRATSQISSSSSPHPPAPSSPPSPMSTCTFSLEDALRVHTKSFQEWCDSIQHSMCATDLLWLEFLGVPPDEMSTRKVESKPKPCASDPQGLPSPSMPPSPSPSGHE